MRALLLSLAVLAAPAFADPIEVDLELFLAVDVSRSMSPAELEIQRRGYASALASDEVITAIQSGLLGRVALTYVEWAGEYGHRVVIDWTMIETAQEAQAFSDLLTARFDSGMRRTSISGALEYATDSIATNTFHGLRRVIDVSGDGPNNQGGPVTRARDAAVAQGIVINGLPLMTREGSGQQWHLEDLDTYYRACVVGGPGAFVIPVHDWSQFAIAVRRKLVLEIAGLTERIHRAQYAPESAYDCLIGEKIWERNRRYWDEP